MRLRVELHDTSVPVSVDDILELPEGVSSEILA